MYLKCFKIVDGEYSTPLRELTPSLAKEEKDEVGGVREGEEAETGAVCLVGFR